MREQNFRYRGLSDLDPNEAINELNARLLEGGVGYQYERGNILKLNSLLIHQEVVLPALLLLADREFKGADSEYREAHRLYRIGDHELCLTECCKAFESVIKTIAEKRAWPVSQNDPASKLVAAVFDHGLIPSYIAAGFTALRSLLESAIPPIRNRSSGHGTGSIPRVIPQYMASFQLAQTAAAITFLVQAHRDTPINRPAGGRPVLLAGR